MDRCWCSFAGTIQGSGERSKQLNHGTDLIMHLVYTIHNWAPVCCYVPGAQPFCRPQSSKGSQEYLNRAFWKLERLPEYKLKSLLRFMGKWLMLTMYKIRSCIPAHKGVFSLPEAYNSLTKLSNSQTLESVPKCEWAVPSKSEVIYIFQNWILFYFYLFAAW